MWHSIEVRVPFLDYDLMQVAQRLSSSLKFDNAQSKFLLVDTFKDVLPREIWDRKKQGFVFPFENWIRNNLSQMMPERQNTALNKRFDDNKLSWSRYWTYLVSQNFIN
jgi:asparagine synthase (glutamine-hydrolysing)